MLLMLTTSANAKTIPTTAMVTVFFEISDLSDPLLFVELRE
jgi:hypothetical protein